MSTTPIAKMPITREDLNFRFTANRLCLDLASTLGERGHRNIERLNGPDDLDRWTVEAGLLDSRLPASEDDLKRVKELRHVIIAVFEGMIRSSRSETNALHELNAFAAEEQVRLQIGSDGMTLRRVPVNGVTSILSSIARDAIDLLASHTSDRLKVCENAACKMVFLDTSRTGNRRWCSMIGIGCGNKAKKRAFNSRQKVE